MSEIFFHEMPNKTGSTNYMNRSIPIGCEINEINHKNYFDNNLQIDSDKLRKFAADEKSAFSIYNKYYDKEYKNIILNLV